MPKRKHGRNAQSEDYFHSLDFFLDRQLKEDYHEVRYFDEFLSSLDDIIDRHKDELFFYTGWNYKPIKEIINGRTKKYGSCKERNDISIDIPIYIRFFNQDIKMMTSVNRKSDKIIISINEFNLNQDYLQFELLHEFTHVVCDYSEENHANLDSLRNSISYEDNIFGLEQNDFEMIETFLYWLNDSEQDGRIGSTLRYIREKRTERKETGQLNKYQVSGYIKETFHLNQIDEFEKDTVRVLKSSAEMTYILGYYMQKHHYADFGLLEYVVRHALENGVFNQETIHKVHDSYYFRFREYRRRLFDYIIKQKLSEQ